MSSVVVIGGGITGLAAGHRLMKGKPDVDVTLLEREPRVGGKLLTEHDEGVMYEAGADAFVARDPAILQLCSDLGLGDDLIAPQVFGAHIWSEGNMKRVPSDWAFGLPTSAAALLKSDLLPPSSKARALLDLVAPGKLIGDDISIGALIRRRYGGAVLERVVDPLLAGSRAGSADEVSLAAAMAPVDSVARTSASITRGLRESRRSGRLPPGPPTFLGLPEGMQRLVDELRRSLTAAELRVGAEAAWIGSSHARYRVGLADGEEIAADAVVLATPAYAAAELLGSLAPDAAGLLAGITYASSAVAVLVYKGGHEAVPDHGSGFLVPSRDHRILSACTWFSKKWLHASTGDDRMVLRCFLGRAGHESTLALDDQALVDLIDNDVRDALHLTSSLDKWRLYRWNRGLPVYRVGHLQTVGRIEAALESHPGIELAGAGYRGSGIPDCVRQGERAASRVLDLVTDVHG